MRAAPAVRVTLTPPVAARAGVALLAALAGAAGAGWVAGHLLGSGVWALAGLLAGAAQGWVLGPTAGAEVAWDGQRWHLDGAPGALAVHIDLHGALLLRWQPEAGRVRWLPVRRRDAGPHWHLLRVALFAGQPDAPADPAGQPPLSP